MKFTAYPLPKESLSEEQVHLVQVWGGGLYALDKAFTYSYLTLTLDL